MPLPCVYFPCLVPRVAQGVAKRKEAIYLALKRASGTSGLRKQEIGCDPTHLAIKGPIRLGQQYHAESHIRIFRSLLPCS